MELAVREARARLSELIAAAQKGERVVITKRGVPAVEFVRCPPRDSRISRRPACHREAQIEQIERPPAPTQASSVSNATMSRDSAPISTPIRWIAHPGARYLSA